MNASRLCRVLAVACLLLAAPAASAADLLEGRVIRIADVETLTVLDRDQVQHRVRLPGIDAPERAQPFGERAKQNLARLVAGRPVEIRWHKRDRYGRVVGQVWVVAPDARCQGAGCPKTLEAGLAQVTAGLAWHYKQYAGEQSEQDRERYAFAEGAAPDGGRRPAGLEFHQVKLCGSRPMARTSRNLGFTVPPRMAEEFERVAEEEGSTKSELFRRMFRLYQSYRTPLGERALVRRAEVVRPSAIPDAVAGDPDDNTSSPVPSRAVPISS